MKAPSSNKELLQLELSDVSRSPGPKWLSICKTKKAENVVSGALKTVPLAGESSVLNRVRAFLPVLDEANRKLEKAIKEKGANDFDIEVLKEHEETSYVEMDLALGVTELHSEEAVSAAQRVAGGQVVGTTSLRSEDSDSENDNPQSEGEGDLVNVLAGRKKRPRIESLG